MRRLVMVCVAQNNLHELWALLNFLLPDVFGSAGERPVPCRLGCGTSYLRVPFSFIQRHSILGSTSRLTPRTRRLRKPRWVYLENLDGTPQDFCDDVVMPRLCTHSPLTLMSAGQAAPPRVEAVHAASPQV